MAEYVIAHRMNGLYTVAKFTDNEFPDHIGTVDHRKKTLKLDFYHKVTQSTIDKYLALVDAYIKDGEPELTVYFASEESPPTITSFNFATGASGSTKRKRRK